ncbi:MAG: HD domain-containing protein [Caldilineaceae bacterium]|nr:HD domain-containing protein [Caldilineaceae bacterium]
MNNGTVRASGPGQQPPAWRDACRAEAHKQALAEEQTVWKTVPEQVVPFHHRWEHVQAVVKLAVWLAAETGADAEVAEAAAWLHDVCKGEANHGVRGAERARQLLAGTDFPVSKVPYVADAIARHAGLYRKPGAAPLTPLETAVLWDADKLTKVGIQALAYALSTASFQGMTLDERRQDMLDFTRTVLSRTVASMNTAPARALAAERYRDMVAFLETWQGEEAVIQDVSLEQSGARRSGNG